MTPGRAGWTVLALAVLCVVGGGLFLRFGVYNVAATAQHTKPVFWLLEKSLVWSIRQHADDIVAPDLDDPDLAQRGFRHFQAHCVQCHGAPGIARDDLGKGMLPLPSNLVGTARTWTAAEIFWTVKHSIKMSGMPGWHYRMADDDIWAITAFVKHLPSIAPADYRERVSRLEFDRLGPADEVNDEATAEGNPDQGRVAIRQYACIAGHTVPGIVGPDVAVGPPLSGMATRKYIAGVLPNTRENMVSWLRDPVGIAPLTAMPDLGVKPRHARDIAAYLATLD